MPATRSRATRADVVRAACEILDEDGVAALTMANVAERVGFTTMAVYRHVKNRDDLIEAAVANALAPVSGGADPAIDWLDGVVAWMHAMRACLRANPWAAKLLGSRDGASAPLQAAAAVLVEHVDRSPLSPHDRARAVTWTARVTIGILVEELASPVAPPLTDDGLYADVVAQTRRFLEGMVP